MSDQIFVFRKVQSLLRLGNDAIAAASVGLDVVNKSSVVVGVARVVVNVGVMMRLFHCFHVIGEVYVDAVVAVIVNDGAALADVIDRWVEEVV